MPKHEITDAEIEAMAMRETTEKSAWYPTIKDKERQRLINRDVDLH
jgi:hypothetical protein